MAKIKRLMIFMPPRHGKSELCSRLFSAYFLYRYPQRWVAVTSYAADLAYTLSRAAQENYREAGGSVKGSASAVKHWETGKGGGFWAAGVGGPATGKGWHLGDRRRSLKNAQEAASEVVRNGQKEWYGSTWYTREEPWSDTDPNGLLIIIQTRWHEDDLAGWQIAEEATAALDPEKANPKAGTSFRCPLSWKQRKSRFRPLVPLNPIGGKTAKRFAPNADHLPS